MNKLLFIPTQFIYQFSLLASLGTKIHFKLTKLDNIFLLDIRKII